LDGLGVREHFDALYGGDSFPVMKPDPAVVENILREQGARREKTVIVGDGPADIAAGKRAGIRTCAALYGFTGEEKLMRLAPDYWIREFVELSGLV
jgi:phosphoglycolate phosphatase-like HAD superfamily hydrolase